MTITVAGDYNGDTRPYIDSKIRVYNDQGKDLNLHANTDAQGRVTFSLPQQPYSFGTVYGPTTYSSDLYTWTDGQLLIPEGLVEVLVERAGEVLPNVQVDVYHNNDIQTGLTGTTDAQGVVSFRLPQGTYKFRAVYLRNTY